MTPVLWLESTAGEVDCWHDVSDMPGTVEHVHEADDVLCMWRSKQGPVLGFWLRRGSNRIPAELADKLAAFRGDN